MIAFGRGRWNGLPVRHGTSVVGNRRILSGSLLRPNKVATPTSLTGCRCCVGCARCRVMMPPLRVLVVQHQLRLCPLRARWRTVPESRRVDGDVHVSFCRCCRFCRHRSCPIPYDPGAAKTTTIGSQARHPFRTKKYWRSVDQG